MPEDAARVLITNSVLGAVAVLEGFAIGFLFWRLDGKDKVIANRDIIIAGLQDKMVEHANTKTEQVITAIKDQTASNITQVQILSGLKELIDKLVWGRRK